jgi:hypothetical protein
MGSEKYLLNKLSVKIQQVTFSDQKEGAWLKLDFYPASHI